MDKKWKLPFMHLILKVLTFNLQVNNLSYFISKFKITIAFYLDLSLDGYFVSLWEVWKGVSRMEGNHEPISPDLIKWNSLLTHLDFHLDFPFNLILFNINLWLLYFHFNLSF